MSKPYMLTNYVYAANRGRDDEFEIVVDVVFKISNETPDYFSKSMGCWYPGDPAELEILDVIFSDEDAAQLYPPAKECLAEQIADYAFEHDADLFFEEAGERAAYEREVAMGL